MYTGATDPGAFTPSARPISSRVTGSRLNDSNSNGATSQQKHSTEVQEPREKLRMGGEHRRDIRNGMASQQRSQTEVEVRRNQYRYKYPRLSREEVLASILRNRVRPAWGTIRRATEEGNI
ncbi:hypothetical protein CPC08DRAFT_725414 [Agrocybe pediades]|nr:hypothetical protein CPC08DRAFT_725414 [Agrocybe pediades]